MKGLWKPSVAKVLKTASFAYLAVETSSGPHVTPLLFAATPDRLWFGIGRGTVKARALAKRDAVGVVVPGPDSSIAIRGHATLLDRLPPSPLELARTPLALPVFASRNALEMAAFARDVLLDGAQPQALAPVSVSVEELEVLPGWSAQAVLSWMTPTGPLALPARWDPETSRARVASALVKHAGGGRVAAACVCVDESDGPGPLAKRGLLVRGTGRMTVRGENATVALDVARITTWKGFDTRTVLVDARASRTVRAARGPRGAKLHT